jgi:hypothetical protein
VSKRNRTSRRTQRRAGDRPPAHPTSRGPAPPSPEPSPAAASEQVGESDEPAAAVVEGSSRPTGRSRRSNARPSGLLARKAEDEYVYVAQDLRHIGMVLGLVLIIFAVLWVLIELLHVVTF